MDSSVRNGVSILDKLLSITQEHPEFTLDHVFMELATILVGVSTETDFALQINIEFLGANFPEEKD